MKIVKDHINEKFQEDDSDPIADMGIGMVNQINNFMKLFGKADKQRYIYAVVSNNEYMDFWFYHKNIIHLSPNKKQNLFNYIKKIINQSGFGYILTNPILFECYYEKLQLKLPRVVRFQIRSQFQHIIKNGDYRRTNGSYAKAEVLSVEDFLYHESISSSYEDSVNPGTVID